MEDKYLDGVVADDCDNSDIYTNNDKIKGIALDVGYTVLNFIFVLGSIVLSLVGIIGLGYGEVDNIMFYTSLCVVFFGILGVVISSVALPIMYYKCGLAYLGEGLVYTLCILNVIIVLALSFWVCL